MKRLVPTLFPVVLLALFMVSLSQTKAQAQVFEVFGKASERRIGWAFAFSGEDGRCRAILPRHILDYGAEDMHDEIQGRRWKIVSGKKRDDYALVDLEPVLGAHDGNTPNQTDRCAGPFPYDDHVRFSKQLGCLDQQAYLAVAVRREGIPYRTFLPLDPPKIAAMSTQRSRPVEMVLRAEDVTQGIEIFDSGSPVWLRDGENNVALIGLLNGVSPGAPRQSLVQILPVSGFSELFFVNTQFPKGISCRLAPVVTEPPDISGTGRLRTPGGVGISSLPTVCDLAAAAGYDPMRPTSVGVVRTLTEVRDLEDRERYVGLCDAEVTPEASPRLRFLLARLHHAGLTEMSEDSDVAAVRNSYARALGAGHVAAGIGLLDLYRGYGTKACIRPGVEDPDQAMRACYRDLANVLRNQAADFPDWLDWALSKFGDPEKGEAFLCPPGALPANCADHFANYLRRLTETGNESAYSGDAEGDLALLIDLNGYRLELCPDANACYDEAVLLYTSADLTGKAAALREYAYYYSFYRNHLTRALGHRPCNDDISCWKLAYPLYLAAAQLDDGKAMFRTGEAFYYHLDATDCTDDANCLNQALQWFEAAYEKGIPRAKSALFRLYANRGQKYGLCATENECLIAAYRYVEADKSERSARDAVNLARIYRNNIAEVACESESACKVSALEYLMEAIQKDSDGEDGWYQRQAADLYFYFAEDGRTGHDPANGFSFHNLMHHDNYSESKRAAVWERVVSELNAGIYNSTLAVRAGDQWSLDDYADTLTDLYLRDHNDHYHAHAMTCTGWETTCIDAGLVFLDTLAQIDRPIPIAQISALVMTGPLVRKDFCRSDPARCEEVYEEALADLDPADVGDWGWDKLSQTNCRIRSDCKDSDYFKILRDQVLSGDQKAEEAFLELVAEERLVCNETACGGVPRSTIAAMVARSSADDTLEKLHFLGIAPQTSLSRSIAIGNGLGQAASLSRGTGPLRAPAERKAFAERLNEALNEHIYTNSVKPLRYEAAAAEIAKLDVSGGPARAQAAQAFIEQMVGCRANASSCTAGIGRLAKMSRNALIVLQRKLGVNDDGILGTGTRNAFTAHAARTCGGSDYAVCRSSKLIEYVIGFEQVLLE